MSNRKPKAKLEEPAPTPSPTPLAPPATTPTAAPTLATPAAAAATPLSFLRSIPSAGAVPHHLVFTTLALLLASGLIARRLHSKNRYRASAGTSKGVKKRKQDVVKSILLAQGQDEALNAVKTRSRSSSTTTPTTTAIPSNLLPSPACITSTSAAIWSNLERIGAVLNPSKNGPSRTASRGGASRKESATQTTPENTKVGKELGNSAKDGGASLKKGKNKKGKGVAATPIPTTSKGSSSDMSRASSKQGLPEDGAEPSKREHNLEEPRHEPEPSPPGSDETASALTEIPDPRSEHPSPSTPNPSKRLPRLSSPDPPTLVTATASVQTSPRLLPYRPRSPSPTRHPRSSDALLTHSTPASLRPKTMPLAFDLHASFQATPSPCEPDDDEAPSTSTSPSLSSSPSHSPSLSASASSGSPSGRRRSSVSTPLLSGSGSKSRKQARKAVQAGLNGKAVVGLPKTAQSVEEGESESKGRARTEMNGDSHGLLAIGKTGANGRDRPAPIPISSHSVRPPAVESTPQPQRRLSTASSSAYSTSNLSLTSSGSPYSTTERPLPTMPPATTMTPPDFARRPSSTAGYDRDETLRWTSSSSTSGRAREASLRGLGVELDRGESEDSSVDGTDARSRAGGSVRAPSPKPPSHRYSQPPIGRNSSYATPESSPHPAHRTVTPFGTPSPSFPPSHQPWSPHASVTSALPYPIASSSSNPAGPNISRPPSRQSSLSVPLNASQQQQLHLQQQQQAYAIAQVQAQAAAQYQHVVALQYQAQLQLQQQQQQQYRGDDSRQRRKAGDGGSGTDESSQVPNGLVHALNSTGQPQAHTWSSGASHPASPMNAAYPAHLVQAVSPTSTTFASNAISPHTQAQMYQSYINQSAAYYLAATNASSPHASPSHHQQHPPRPRISSSVSAVASLGGGGGSGGGAGGGRHGSVASPVSNSSVASPRITGGDKQRAGSVNPFSPLGAGAGGTGPGNDISGWKARANQAEMEADRNAKELEIARWRLSVLEGEHQANEVENQEALRALATRAMRAEARIKLFEESRKPDVSHSPSVNAVDSPPVPSPAAASPAAPKPIDLTPSTPGEAHWRAMGEDSQALNGGPGSGIHPLSWLDLDSISFSTRPLNPPRPPLNSSYSSSSNTRKRAGRNSHGNSNGNNRRQSGNHSGRRKSSNNHLLSPSLHLSVPSPSESGDSSPTRGDHDAREPEEEDDEEVVIVLNASSKRAARSPSRRSSYAASSSGGAGYEDGLGIHGGAAEDGSSYIDEDDIPTIEFDLDPMASSRLHLDPRSVLPQVNGHYSDGLSQSGSAYGGEGDDEPVDYVGFLPGFLSRVRTASGPPPPSDHAEEEEEADQSGHAPGRGGEDEEEGFDVTTPEARNPDPRFGGVVAADPVICNEFALAAEPLDALDSTPPPSPPRPRALFHPVPTRPPPAQIALPPSPTRSSSPVLHSP